MMVGTAPTLLKAMPWGESNWAAVPTAFMYPDPLGALPALVVMVLKLGTVPAQSELEKSTQAMANARNFQNDFCMLSLYLRKNKIRLKLNLKLNY
jgi:hypothetical protein